jgi:hypothetical protein
MKKKLTAHESWHYSRSFGSLQAAALEGPKGYHRISAYHRIMRKEKVCSVKMGGKSKVNSACVWTLNHVSIWYCLLFGCVCVVNWWTCKSSVSTICACLPFVVSILILYHCSQRVTIVFLPFAFTQQQPSYQHLQSLHPRLCHAPLDQTDL